MMQIRDNVRRRRQERIVQLLGRRSDDYSRTHDAETPAGLSDDTRKLQDKPMPPDPVPVPSSPQTSAPAQTSLTDLDPELWWKQQQKRLNRSKPTWQGAGSLAATSVPPAPVTGRTSLSRLAAGLAVRIAIAAVLYGAFWLWLQSDLPGNQAVRAWTANAVTHDMDFQAIEAWYDRNFGGSPSFLPVFRSGKEEAQAVSGEWKRSEAVPPAAGKIVQTFKQDGSGIRIAAEAGREVVAAYAGRVMQVTTDADGRSTIQIQHAGQIVTQYGNVSQSAVHVDDWVMAGQRLGAVPAPKDKGGESLLIFAVKQNGTAVDPAEVVPFD